LKLIVFIHQLRNRRDELELANDKNDRANKLQDHKKRLTKTLRSIRLIYASLLVGCAECIPLGILQIMYSLRVAEKDAWGSISLVTTWLGLGLKVAKVPELQTLWKYKKKQKKKCAALAAPERARATDEGTVGSIEATSTRPRPESIEMSQNIFSGPGSVVTI